MKDLKQFIKTNIQEFLNENKNSTLPQYLYHLTSLEKFENIKKDGGLKPEFSKQSKGEKGIYLTDDISVAKNYSGFYDTDKSEKYFKGDFLILNTTPLIFN